MKRPGFLRRRIVDPIVRLLRQGISAEKVGLGLACGIVIGIFPVVGVTTIICTVVAIIFRLNLPAIQLVNYLVYPLQFALLIPFFHFGDWLFGLEPLPYSAQELVALFKSDFWGTVNRLWDTTLRAIAAWSIVCLPAVALLYYTLTPLLRRLKISRAST
jgi:uncharacterized protein (DUF2062 family)